MQCALCAEPIGGDPDALALICKNGHNDGVHDKCCKNRYSNHSCCCYVTITITITLRYGPLCGRTVTWHSGTNGSPLVAARAAHNHFAT